jgi:transposase
LTTFPEILALAELGREQVLSVEDWAEIRRLRRAEGMPIAEIARVMGISRNTVKAALASDNPPKYARAPQGSVADAFEPRIRELLAAFPSMPATVIAERVGWPYSVRTLSGKVAQWRPAYLPPDPASRTAYAAEEIAGARDAGLPGISSFAKGLEQDLDAVTQGLTSRWNSGPVEGRVNHIKMIKRQMFGRASLPLLRKRVLLTAQN